MVRVAVTGPCTRLWTRSVTGCTEQLCGKAMNRCGVVHGKTARPKVDPSDSRIAPPGRTQTCHQLKCLIGKEKTRLYTISRPLYYYVLSIKKKEERRKKYSLESRTASQVAARRNNKKHAKRRRPDTRAARKPKPFGRQADLQAGTHLERQQALPDHGLGPLADPTPVPLISSRSLHP
jgi:hypothetical protein